jgi:protein-tyrosine-phosphatase
MTPGLPTLCAVGISTLAVAAGYLQSDAVRSTKTTTVLFICPHGAAKSVLASAYFQQLAKERGLSVRVETAGTEPEAEVSPAVARHLKKQGVSVPIEKPRAVTAKDLEAADVVISMGCDVSGVGPVRGDLRKWDDVPPVSEKFSAADEAIRRKVTDLIEELVSRKPK